MGFNIERTNKPFVVKSPYKPSGDQPKAIEELAERIENGENDVVLMGATGTGKTATTAWLIERLQRPTLIIEPNKTLAAQLCAEFRELMPDNAVSYFVSYYDYYQPEAYIPQTDTYIEKDSNINDDVERLRHAATANLLTRRDCVVVATVSCIYGLGTPEEYAGRMLFLEKASRSTVTTCCVLSSPCSTSATISPSPEVLSVCAAIPSKSFPYMRNWPSVLNSSVMKSTVFQPCIHLPEM